MMFSFRLRIVLIIIFLLFILVPLLMIKSYIVKHFNTTSENLVVTTQFAYLYVVKHYLESFLTTVSDDLLFLTQSVPMTTYLAVRNQMLTSSAAQKSLLTKRVEQQRQDLAQEFLAFSHHRGIYYQVRYLDETGQEVVRVDSTGMASKIIAQDNLQDKSGRYYFSATLSLSQQEIFVSPLDLNREHGQIERPLKPVIRYATNVYYNQVRKAGIVILNIDANRFLKLVGNIRLVDQAGYFINHPDAVRCWGGPNDLNTHYKLSQEYPQLAEHMVGQTGVQKTDTLIISHQKVKVPHSLYHWTLILSTEKNKIPFQTTLLYVILTFILVSIGLAGLSWVIVIHNRSTH